MGWIISFVLVDAVSVFLFSRLSRGDGRFRFAAHPAFAFGFTAGAVTLIGVGGFHYWHPSGIMDTFICCFGVAAFALPCGLLPAYALGDRFADFLVTSGVKNIQVAKSCDRAEKAEREEDYAEAERCYREAIQRPRRAHKKDELLYAPVHLKFGNFLQQRGRLAEAAEQWEQALDCGLPPEQAAVTGLRAAEALNGQLQKRAEAIAILEKVLARYPKAHEAAPLRQRLALLKGT